MEEWNNGIMEYWINGVMEKNNCGFLAEITTEDWGSRHKAKGDRFKGKRKQLSRFLLTSMTKFNGNRLNVDIF
jgi:hypothetical protein